MSSTIQTIVEHLEYDDTEQCQRLFHGRGHAFVGFEHVCIDWLPPIALITLYQQESIAFLQSLSEFLKDKLTGCTSVQVQHRWQPRSPFELVLGENISETQVVESGLKYHIELGQAQNTGLFLDMKNGRDWVRNNANKCNVLNLFSYTCAFSVAAIAGGAEQVVNIDLSKASLSKGRENHRLNDQRLEQVKFQGVDIFKSFGRLKKFGPYQLVIVDPPSFQKGSVNIEKDYGKILRRLPEMLSDKAKVMLCLNNPDLDENFLFEKVAEFSPQLDFVDRIIPPSVFREAKAGKGLKVLTFTYHASKHG